MTKKNSRRAFDHARGNLWSIDPLDLSIIGGAALAADERGPLDTDDGPEHDLYDERVRTPLTEDFCNNVAAHGVDTPILICKLGDVATVIAGRKRVRAARLVNIARKKAGEPLIKIDCKLKRATGSSLLAAMITENEARTNDAYLAKIEKLKRLMNRGVSEEDAAINFSVPLYVIRGMLAFEDCATPETKDAVRAGRLSASAAAELTKITDADAQNTRLADLIGSGEKVTARKVKIVNKQAHGKSFAVSDKKTQVALLTVIQGTSHPNASDKTSAWWEGVEEAIKLMMGAEDIDTRLKAKLEEAMEMRKAAKKTKAAAKVDKADRKAPIAEAAMKKRSVETNGVRA